MMLTLGLFVFQLQTVPYQSLQRDVDYRWPVQTTASACARCRSSSVLTRKKSPCPACLCRKSPAANCR
jgi:hypothetical protein